MNCKSYVRHDKMSTLSLPDYCFDCFDIAYPLTTFDFPFAIFWILRHKKQNRTFFVPIWFEIQRNMSIGLQDRNALDDLCQYSLALPGSSSNLVVIIINMCVSHLMDYYPSSINTYASKCHLVNHPFDHILHLHLHLNISIKYQMGLHLKTIFNFESNTHWKIWKICNFVFMCSMFYYY
mgnify:CR=1 FL=1